MSFPLKAFLEETIKQKKSDEFLASTKEYISTLQGRNFPVIFSIPHLAIEIGMQSSYINFLIESRESQYTIFKIRKKRKDTFREIMAPKEELKYLQRWINYNILQNAGFNEYTKGFIPGISIFDNAKIHENSKYLLKIDLWKFFDTIDEKRVYKVFKGFGYSKSLSWDFAKICTYKHAESFWKAIKDDEVKKAEALINSNPSVLPQGAPTSPLLANLVANQLDSRIGSLAKKMGCKYTRYADDLCFSADEEKSIPKLSFLRKIIEEEGFLINERKVKYAHRGIKQYVTGLSIDNGISVQKSKRKEIFKHLYFANKFGFESHIEHLKSRDKYRTNYQNWLLGHISFQYSINKKIEKKMFDIYNKINWNIDNEIETNVD